MTWGDLSPPASVLSGEAAAACSRERELMETRDAKQRKPRSGDTLASLLSHAILCMLIATMPNSVERGYLLLSAKSIVFSVSATISCSVD